MLFESAKQILIDVGSKSTNSTVDFASLSKL